MPPSTISPSRPKHFDVARIRTESPVGRPAADDRPERPNQGRRLQDLHARVVDALVNSGYAALSLIGCDVDHNRVILRGSVPSYHLKQLAQVHVLRVEGIGRLENRLEVRGSGPC